VGEREREREREKGIKKKRKTGVACPPTIYQVLTLCFTPSILLPLSSLPHSGSASVFHVTVKLNGSNRKSQFI